MNLLIIINIIIMSATGLFFLFLAVTSLLEREYRAVIIAFISLLLNLSLWTALSLYSGIARVYAFNVIAIAALIAFGLVSLVKYFPREPGGRELSGAVRYDERDNMFSRNNMQYYPRLMEEYYQHHPERVKGDREIHNRPEFGSSEHSYYDFYATPCFVSAFKYLQRTIPASGGEPATEKKSVDRSNFLDSLKAVASFYGASDLGVTPLKDYHLYSHRGRHSSNWGEKVRNTHQTAIVIVVAMDVDIFKTAPTNAVIQESARKYVEVAKISNILAQYIREFGYRATAHNDANYETLCVPLAVDSGLGELGRMGLFMHGKFGPCVRLAVVTTELELPPAEGSDYHMEEFCRICKKCSDNCPTGAISGEDETESRGFRHWSINQERCFAFWKRIGTDCGFCVAVCPYTKPDNFLHRLVRFYVSRNPLNQRVALFFDDLLYGRRIKPPPENPEKIF